MSCENGYVKSTKIWFTDLDDLVSPLAVHAVAAWDRLELPHEEHECEVTVRAWMSVNLQAYYTVTISYDEDTIVFVAEGYSIPVRSANGIDWSECAENGVWTSVASMVGEDPADRLTGADLIRWMRAMSR
jgi:hypothetical protein